MESLQQSASRLLRQKQGVPTRSVPSLVVGGVTRRVGQSDDLIVLDVPNRCDTCRKPGYYMVRYRSARDGWAVSCMMHLEATVERCQKAGRR